MINKNEIELILKEAAPNLEINFSSSRNVSTHIIEAILFCSGIGVFSGIWNLYVYLSEKKDKYSIKINYETIDGKNVEILLKSLKEKEFKDFLLRNPPKNENSILLLLQDDPNTNDKS